MYCKHYGFSEKPFDVTPEPRFLYMAPDHQETLAALIYGIQERRGFVAIVGEVGTGKTTLLNAALDRIDPHIKTAYIFNTSVSFVQLLNMINHELCLAEFSEQLSKLDAIHRLNRFAVRQLAKGGTVALIIDEAQNLSSETLEDLRMLSNLETRKHKLVQIVLSGQPELEAKLTRYDMRQLTQRISIMRYVRPFKEKDTYLYLQHRLKIVNYDGSSLFTRKAQRLIWEYSGGIPRKINMLCDNALLIGYGLKQKKIHTETIQEVIADLTWSGFSDTEPPVDAMPPAKVSPRRRPKSRRRSFAWATALMLAIFLFFAGGFYLGRSDLHSPGVADFLDTVKSHVAPIMHSLGITGNTQPDKPEPPKQQVIAQKTEATTQPLTDDKPQRYSIQQATEDFQAFPKTLAPGNAIASEIKLVTNLSEKETISNQSAQEQIVKSTGEIDVNGPAIVSTIPVETDIKSMQVKVQSGETLFQMIIERCGTFDEAILTRVLEENPDITNPNRIRAGQIITLPVSSLQKVD